MKLRRPGRQTFPRFNATQHRTDPPSQVVLVRTAVAEDTHSLHGSMQPLGLRPQGSVPRFIDHNYLSTDHHSRPL